MSSFKLLNKPMSTRLGHFMVIRRALSNQEVLKHRARLFNEEQQRQLKEVQRVEKIEVKHVGESEKVKLIMNKDLSTPYNCAMHLSELNCTRSVIALVDGTPWDIHRPLEKSCELKFEHFKDENPQHSNRAYWRSCSFILGYLLETSFKQNFFVDIHSFPPPNIHSGSFVYDAKLNIPDWKPSGEELRCMSIGARKLHTQNLKFERLQIKKDLAEEMFRYNKFKLEQIPAIVEKSENKNSLTVYKVGDFVDISKGPMIANTSLIGRFEVTGVFNVDNPKHGTLQRIQGVSIPAHLNLHFWTFNMLARRAAKVNTSDKGIDYLSGEKKPTLASVTA